MNNRTKDYILVSTQFLLFLLYLWNPWKKTLYQNDTLTLWSLILVFIGIILLGSAVYALRKSISPFPSPKSNAQLVHTGVYHYIRHPIYTAILTSAFGWAVYSNSWFRILIFVALILLFEVKSNFEEQLLIKRYSNYENYKKQTGKYLPKFN